MIEKLSTGTWVIENDDHLAIWIKQAGGHFARGDSGLEAALTVLKPGDGVIDIGCNIGGLSHFFAEAVGQRGAVLGIDANPECVECARNNCRQPWAEFRVLALGDEPGESRLHLLTNIGASYLSPDGEVPVQVATLDWVNQYYGLWPTSFIKIDAEGYEPKILRGGAMTIESFRPHMVIEVNRGALARYGDTADGLLKQIEDMGYNWAPVLAGTKRTDEQFDILCVPK